MKIKRWTWLLATAPVMWSLLQLANWADRLYAWQYSEGFARPTAADFTRAAVVFWVAWLTPISVGLLLAVLAFRRKYQPRWTVLEAAIVAFPYLAAAMGLLNCVLYASLMVGGAVVVSLCNLGACMRQRTWGKLTLSAVALGGGMLYLGWLYAFILYVDT